MESQHTTHTRTNTDTQAHTGLDLPDKEETICSRLKLPFWPIANVYTLALMQIRMLGCELNSQQGYRNLNEYAQV